MRMTFDDMSKNVITLFLLQIMRHMKRLSNHFERTTELLRKPHNLYQQAIAISRTALDVIITNDNKTGTTRKPQEFNA